MSDCRLTLVAEHESGIATYACQRCKREHKSKYTPDKIHRNCTAAKKCENAGPGTELERILKWFGVRVKRGCGCKDWVRWMNAIGVEGCRAESKAIIDHLREEAKQRRPWKWLFTRCGARLILWLAIKRAV